MEFDRYEHNKFLYVLGIICMILSLGLIFLSLYVIPYLLWNTPYQIPSFVPVIIEFFKQDYGFDDLLSNMLVWLVFFIPGIITGFLSYYISNYIDGHIIRTSAPDEEQDSRSTKNHNRRSSDQGSVLESARLGFKILLIMLLIMGVGLLATVFFELTL